MQVTGSNFDQMGAALIDFIGLKTSTDCNRLLNDLKLVIIDFRMSVDSQLY